MIQLDRDAAQARVISREAVAGEILVFLASDLAFLEVVEVVVGAAKAARGHDRVTCVAARLRPARLHDFLNEIGTRPEIGEAVAAIGRRRR